MNSVILCSFLAILLFASISHCLPNNGGSSSRCAEQLRRAVATYCASSPRRQRSRRAIFSPEYDIHDITRKIRAAEDAETPPGDEKAEPKAAKPESFALAGTEGGVAYAKTQANSAPAVGTTRLVPPTDGVPYSPITMYALNIPMPEPMPPTPDELEAMISGDDRSSRRVDAHTERFVRCCSLGNECYTNLLQSTPNFRC